MQSAAGSSGPRPPGRPYPLGVDFAAVAAMRPTLLIVPCLLSAVVGVDAAEGRSGLSALALFDPANEGWTYNAKLGLLGTATTVSNQQDSYDTTIAGASSTASVLGTADLRALFRAGNESLEHTLSLRYGQIQDSNSSHFIENEDEIRYDGVYRHLFARPHFTYALLGADTVATGPRSDDPAVVPDDYRKPFDPFQARVSTGYGQRYEQWLPDDFLEWRLGARYQRRWGSIDPPTGRDTGEFGWEGYIRYEATPQPLNKGFTFFVQYEIFSEANDMAHTTNLLTGSLAFNFTKYLQLQLAIRGYYETRPKEAKGADTGEDFSGYNQLSYKYDNMLGLTYIY